MGYQAKRDRQGGMGMFFTYTSEATDYLASRDRRLGLAIRAVDEVRGHVLREVDEGLFPAVIHHIVGQQISNAAQRTVWERLRRQLGEICPARVGAADIGELQACGISFRKAEYIKDFARKVDTGEFDLAAIEHMDDASAIAALSSLKGIGTWTAEMLLLFCLQRPDILSYDDLAIQRGMRMVYHHRKIAREQFERYRRRYSPYGSVASLYLWAIAAGDVPGFERDYAPLTDAQKRARRRAREQARRAGGAK